MISLSARNTQNRRSTGWMRRECLAAVTPTFQAPAPTAAVQCPPSLGTYGINAMRARAQGYRSNPPPHRRCGGKYFAYFKFLQRFKYTVASHGKQVHSVRLSTVFQCIYK
jgi:hypothetical protein